MSRIGHKIANEMTSELRDALLARMYPSPGVFVPQTLMAVRARVVGKQTASGVMKRTLLAEPKLQLPLHHQLRLVGSLMGMIGMIGTANVNQPRRALFVHQQRMK